MPQFSQKFKQKEKFEFLCFLNNVSKDGEAKNHKNDMILITSLLKDVWEQKEGWQFLAALE